MSKPRVALTIVALTALALLSLGSPALAKDGDVLVRGTCTGPSTAKLKLSEENGRIEVEFEVDQNRNGVRWNIVLTRNGGRVAELARVTRAPSGSFEARRVLANADRRRCRPGDGSPGRRDVLGTGDLPRLRAPGRRRRALARLRHPCESARSSRRAGARSCCGRP